MKDEEQPSVYVDDNFKRCEDNYYEFYSKYQNQGGKGLPPPLENQPFLMDRSYHDDEDHLHPSVSHSNSQPSHQQLQQLQQLHQQQLQQMQLQQQFQQQQQQQQQIMHSHQRSQQHPQQHLQQLQHPSHPQHQLSQQQQHIQQLQLQQQQIQQQIQQQQQQMHNHPSHPSQLHQQHSQPQFQHLPSQQHPLHHQHLPPQQPSHQQFQHQGHSQHLPHQSHSSAYNMELKRLSVPDISRNPPSRGGSNSYLRAYDRFDTVPEESTHIDEIPPSTSPTNDTIWGPVHRKSFSGIEDMHKPVRGSAHGHPAHGLPAHNITAYALPPGGQPPRDPTSYYQSDFDHVISATNLLLNEDVKDMKEIWNDRGFDRAPAQVDQHRQHLVQHPQAQQSFKHPLPHITAPTPTVSSQSSLLSLLGNGIFNTDAPVDKLSQRRRASSGGPPPAAPPSTSPTLPICRYYAQGFCSRGERCNFLHEEQSQLNQLQQDRSVGDFSNVKQSKPKTKSPPPIAMPNYPPPKVPSPIHMRMGPSNGTNANGAHLNGTNGAGHGASLNAGLGAGLGGSLSPNLSNGSLSSLLANMNLGNSVMGNGVGGTGGISPTGAPATSPH